LVRFLLKKKTKLNFFFLKNRNRVKPTSFGSVRFFWAKTGFSGLARFFRFGSVFFGFGSVWFFTYKTETKPNRTSRFFLNFNRFNRFFFGLVFQLFFPDFFGLISFLIFLLTPG
jgi:hypothetical protein